MPPSFTSNRRYLAAGAHLLVSGLVAMASALLVFFVWYPSPYATIAGGANLFLLMITVDVILGPSLTLVAASPKKSRRELTGDLLVIFAFQAAGFAYGIYTMALARPVVLSFEIDRFRVVTAAEIDPVGMGGAPEEMRSLSWIGPRLIGAIKPTNPDEQFRSIELGMHGVDLSMVPSNWVPYAVVSEEAWRKGRPLNLLVQHYPEAAKDVARIAADSGMSVSDLRFLPLMSRRASWVTIVSLHGNRVVAHLPFDGFF